MNKKGMFWFAQIIGTIGILIVVLLFAWMFYIDSYGSIAQAREECENLDGCEVFKCKSENVLFIFQSSNYELKYSNCLLEEQKK